jgi:hypothetical protein
MKRNCLNCGEEFAARKVQRYCSNSCAAKARTEIILRVCEFCKKEFPERRPRKFCSRRCHGKHNSAQFLQKAIALKKLCKCGCGGWIEQSLDRKSTQLFHKVQYLPGHQFKADERNKRVREAVSAAWSNGTYDGSRVAPGVLHHGARIWRLRSPKNKVYEFRNLQEFIRQNPGLFDPEDVVIRSYGKSRAASGLGMLSERWANGAGSWKGWTWASQVERLKNDGKDLLDRPEPNDQAHGAQDEK